MGFMKAWEEWSQNLWDKWGVKIQPTYDKIDSWTAPSWLKKACEKVWVYLDAETKKKLYEFIMEIVKKYDSKFAKEFLQDLLNKLLELFRVKEKD